MNETHKCYIQSESGEELDVGTRADEIAFYKTLQREKIVIPVQTKEDEIIDVMRWVLLGKNKLSLYRGFPYFGKQKIKLKARSEAFSC